MKVSTSGRRLSVRQLVIAAVAALLVIGAAPAGVAEAEEPTTWFVDESKLPFDPIPGVPAAQYWGIVGTAGFRAEVPENWNGELVMWAHGFRGEGLELTVDNHPIRQHLLERGYAWAASSYERNSYDVLTGVESTKALVDHVNAEILAHEAGRVYMTGASMGGHVTAVSIEKYHEVYHGAMPICGVLGSYELFDFFLDYMLGAQQLVFGEAEFPLSDLGEWYGETVPTMKERFSAVPGGFPFLLSEEGEQFKAMVEWQTGGPRPNFDEAFAFWHGFDSGTGFGNFLFDLGIGDGTLPNSNGLSVVENNRTRYRLDGTRQLDMREERVLNREIPRYSFDRGARSTGESITGRIRDRVLSLHNLGDLFVPFEMERDYAYRVRNQGRSNRLVQRAIRGSGHCDFTQYELTTAFDDLTNWVETGVRPAGDNVLSAREVASDDFGCRFSDPDHTLHQFATPCD